MSTKKSHRRYTSEPGAWSNAAFLNQRKFFSMRRIFLIVSLSVPSLLTIKGSAIDTLEPVDENDFNLLTSPGLTRSRTFSELFSFLFKELVKNLDF
jgi:hypothetical protein